MTTIPVTQKASEGAQARAERELIRVAREAGIAISIVERAADVLDDYKAEGKKHETT